MRIALAVLMALHGIAHLPGFAVPWRLTESPEMPYTTTLLDGRVDVGDAGIRAMGVLWLLTALAFVAAAMGTWTQRPWALTFATACALVSLLLSVLALPRSIIGVPVNAVILLWLLLGTRYAWFATAPAIG